MLKVSCEKMAHELAYRQYMADTSTGENKEFWDGACTAARGIIHAMQDENEGYPFAYKERETESYVVYRVRIGEYKAEIMFVN